MKLTSAFALTAAVSLSSLASAQAPATLTVTGDVTYNTGGFTNASYNAVLPGQPVTFTCSISVIPRPETAPSFVYPLDPAAMTLDIGVAVSESVTPTVDSFGICGDAINPNGLDQLGVFGDFPSNIGFLALASAPTGGITTSDLLTQNGSTLLTGLATGSGSLFTIAESGGSSPAPTIGFGNVTINLTVPSAVGLPYCTTTPNSTGVSGSLTVAGVNVANANDFTMLMHQLPVGQFGMAIASRTQNNYPNPNGQGTICVGGTIARFDGPGQLQQSDSDGFAMFQVDLTMIPEGSAIVSALGGETWNWQYWHRDVVGGAQSSNLTNPITVTFQ